MEHTERDLLLCKTRDYNGRGELTLFVSSDIQQNNGHYVVRGTTENGDSYLIDHGTTSRHFGAHPQDIMESKGFMFGVWRPNTGIYEEEVIYNCGGMLDKESTSGKYPLYLSGDEKKNMTELRIWATKLLNEKISQAPREYGENWFVNSNLDKAYIDQMTYSDKVEGKNNRFFNCEIQIIMLIELYRQGRLNNKGLTIINGYGG